MKSDFKAEYLLGNNVTGKLLEVNVPGSLPWRKIWAFYQPQTYPTGQFAAWLDFYDGGDQVLRLPALVQPATHVWIGVCASASSLVNTGNNTAPSLTPGQPDGQPKWGMYFKYADNSNAYWITPFDVPLNCTRVELNTTATARPTWAFLGCLSSENILL